VSGRQQIKRYIRLTTAARGVRADIYEGIGRETFLTAKKTATDPK
jgi:hypothetical protein